jgi:hypothetical protein
VDEYTLETDGVEQLGTVVGPHLDRVLLARMVRRAVAASVEESRRNPASRKPSLTKLKLPRPNNPPPNWSTTGPSSAP